MTTTTTNTQTGRGFSLGSLFSWLGPLVGIITRIEAAFGPGNGASKKHTAIIAFEVVLQELAPFIEARNPAYAAVISDVVDFLVKQLNVYEGLSDHPVPVPVPVPPPPPPAVPPRTTAPYDYWFNAPLPSDTELQAKGFAAGDAKWVGNGLVQWYLIGHPGGIPSSPPDGSVATAAGFVQ